MKIAFGCDHSAFKLKTALVEYVRELGHEVEDFGCMSEESVDYPDYAALVADAVADGRFDRGILICYTGIGMSITANKVQGVRCALCSEPVSASLTRGHNNTNVLSMGAGMIGLAMAREIVRVWLSTEFEGGRHQRRVDKITAYEAR